MIYRVPSHNPKWLGPPTSRIVGPVAPPVGEPEGAAAITETDDTSTATGTVASPVQMAFPAVVPRRRVRRVFRGATNRLPSLLTHPTGTSATTETADTSTASGTHISPITGTATPTETNDTSTASGTAFVPMVVSPSPATLRRIRRIYRRKTNRPYGQIAFFYGTSATTETADTSTASGTHIIPITGTASPTEEDDTPTAAGTTDTPPVLAFDPLLPKRRVRRVYRASTARPFGFLAATPIIGSAAINEDTIASPYSSTTVAEDADGFAGGGTLLVDKPPGGESGDVYFMFALAARTGALPLITVSGFSAQTSGDNTDSTPEWRMRALTKTHTGSEGATFTATSSSTIDYLGLGVMLMRGVDTSNIVDASAAMSGQSGTSAVIPQVITNSDNCGLICVVGCSTGTITTTNPGNGWVLVESFLGDTVKVFRNTQIRQGVAPDGTIDASESTNFVGCVLAFTSLVNSDESAVSASFTPPPITGTATPTETDDTSTASGAFASPIVLAFKATPRRQQRLRRSYRRSTVRPHRITGVFTGSSAAAETADTSTASGTFTPAPITGTATPTESDDTSTASGTVGPAPITGTATPTEGDDTSTASGALGALVFFVPAPRRRAPARCVRRPAVQPRLGPMLPVLPRVPQLPRRLPRRFVKRPNPRSLNWRIIHPIVGTATATEQADNPFANGHIPISAEQLKRRRNRGGYEPPTRPPERRDFFDTKRRVRNLEP